MIKNTRQDWTPGATVKVGFLSLVVVAAIPTPGDYAPDAYILKNAAGTKLYHFVPHNGIEAVSLAEAQADINSAKASAARIASEAISRAAAVADLLEV